MKKRILTLALTVILVLNFAGVANAAENLISLVQGFS